MAVLTSRRVVNVLAIAMSTCLPFQAAISSPVLVEMYTNNACDVNSDIMQSVTTKLKADDDIIFLSCWMTAMPNSKDVATPYAHGFCDSDRTSYSSALGFFGVKTPLIVVNGRYEANPNRVEAAINLAKSADDAKYIALEKGSDQSLSITVPGLPDGTKASGEVFVYAYAPIEGGAHFDSVPKYEGTPDGMIVVQAVAQDLVRPIVSAEKVADWSGEDIRISFALDQDANDLLGHDASELGYVAVLHEGHRFGPVLAVGEIKADELASKSMSLKPEGSIENDAPMSIAPSSQSPSPDQE